MPERLLTGGNQISNFRENGDMNRTEIYEDTARHRTSTSVANTVTVLERAPVSLLHMVQRPFVRFVLTENGRFFY